MPDEKELNLSVVIITLNEERHLERCLKSLPAGAEVIILDSGSTDKTKEIAHKFNAAWWMRPFDDYARQKNAALEFATRDWILSLDADEEVSPELKAALVRFIKASPPRDKGFKIRRNLIFLGRQLRFGRSGDTPLRLFPRGSGSFVAAIHEMYQLQPPFKRRTFPHGRLRHYSYDNLSDYFERFNRYTSQIALNHHRTHVGGPHFLRHIFRPWFEFGTRYFLRGGFLDGYPGYCYALISSLYTFIKYAKLRELQEDLTAGAKN